MPTTTIRLGDDLKARVAATAEQASMNAHAFIVEAIEQTVERTEQANEFHRIAEERWRQLLASGKSIPFEEARVYLEARARGERPPRPVARKPGR